MKQTDAATTDLATSLQFIKGVGPQRASQLERKGLRTVEDALFFVPLRHEDRTRLTPFRSLVPGQAATCAGVIVGVSPPPPGRFRVPFTVMLRDASGYATASWFGWRYLSRVLKRGQQLVLHGRVGRYKGAIVLQQPDYEIVENGETSGCTPAGWCRCTRSPKAFPSGPLPLTDVALVESHAADVAETLPDAVRARRGLVGLAQAVRDAHFPRPTPRWRGAAPDLVRRGAPAAARARDLAKPREPRTRAGDEPARRSGGPAARAAAVEADGRAGAGVGRRSGATWPSRTRCIVCCRGDVGSGKTIVAALGVLIAIEAGYQAAVMAPTEILAEQHFMTFRQLLEPLGVRVTLLTSSLKPRDRAARRASVTAGEVECVVGTHALVQEGVEFRRLGLAVVDEQHRFGVEQRARLRGKGEHPDLLVMTATPIPRTLALTIYGDLDVSVLDELPPGRRPIVTVARSEGKRRAIYKFLREQIAGGRQIYVVYPLVEESEALDLKAATDMARHLADAVFPDLVVGLLHGRLGFDEKDAIMRRFKAGEIHVLVSTTVIEVGIDVPNAAVMLIEHAERFGLSQLHQLRGRVGRGEWKSYCILLTSGRLTEEAQRRIDAMTSTNDGFRIAEVDLELRGPGEFFGTRQSGLPEFRSADLLQDTRLLEEARREATAIIARDRELSDPANRALRTALLARWRGKLALATAG
jgi:ATP-dependent DNA helicase RecG